jgi:hypothetical protein
LPIGVSKGHRYRYAIKTKISGICVAYRNARLV